MISRLLQAGRVPKTFDSFCLEPSEITRIASAASDILLAEPTLLELSAPIKIVGDIYGQYTELLRLFDLCGGPSTTNYLFLGNYVDHGRQSLETILLLLCYKLKYPETFFLLRGHHECASVNRTLFFYQECRYRSNKSVWKPLNATLNCLPIAAVLSRKTFCVHGGLSPSLSNLDDIRAIARPTDVPDIGLLCDLLWSDPVDMEEEWSENHRGVSYYFNRTVTQAFLERNGLDMICRGHEVVEAGYKFLFDKSLVTIFSAPDHCDENENSAAVMSVSVDLSYSFETMAPERRAMRKRHGDRIRDKGDHPSS
ncbi:Serine/threonine-protein phosphatase PP1 [Aspergillus pseudoustus]|uniref:protein-serine/threonine phosphatase n=1 Tax=Aspergillus pseudoustus TaxID=1810923 RepID=A0ABR4KCD4_9EURO